MLMAGGSEIKRILIPAATYQAVCFDVWDLGFHKSGFFDDDTQEEIVQHKIKFGWELDERFTDGELEGKRYRIYQDYTLILGEKANLERLISNWRGTAVTVEERKNQIDIEKFAIGRNCMLSVIHKTSKKGNVYHTVGTVMQLPKGMPPIRQESEREIPKWIQKTIDQAQEYDNSEPVGKDTSESDAEKIPF